MRIAIIDSSCLISLSHLNLASKLALYFDVIYVPRTVQIEFNRKHRSRYRLNKLFEAGVFQKCLCKDETSFQFLLAELDAGEAEGLIQAQERGVEFFLVDERQAREIALRQGLTLYGTVRLLARFCLEGYADDIWALVRKLRKECKFRVADEVVRSALASAATPIGRFSDSVALRDR
jgi:predicted nucleic acid-binding protein